MMTIEDLPENLVLFPLSGALLLPRGRLPLNIFEPRYLAMIEDSLATSHRLIGMIQPAIHPRRFQSPFTGKKEGAVDIAHLFGDKPVAGTLYPIGCAGRITSFCETDDGRYLITLTGICRFAIAEELPLQRSYRQIRPRWADFLADFHEETVKGFDRQRLLTALRGFLRLHGIASDWEAIERTPDDRLITSLAMICPFSPGEKQALLESASLSDRASTMTALIETVVNNCPGPSASH